MNSGSEPAAPWSVIPVFSLGPSRGVQMGKQAAYAVSMSTVGRGAGSQDHVLQPLLLLALCEMLKIPLVARPGAAQLCLMAF